MIERKKGKFLSHLALIRGVSRERVKGNNPNTLGRERERGRERKRRESVERSESGKEMEREREREREGGGKTSYARKGIFFGKG